MNRSILGIVGFMGLFSAIAMPVPAIAEIEEIVVTARKQDEGLQQVPVTVTALTADEIDQKGIDGLESLSTAVAGLFIDENSAGQTGLISIRGIGSSALNQTIEQAVSVNLDGMAISNGNVLRLGQIDLERAEVLKGPQALFFGKNSPGGVISLKTADPTEEFFFQVRTGYEWNAEQAFGEAVVSGPLNDKVGYRAVLHYSDEEGPFENVVTGDDNAFGSEELFARLSLHFNPTEDLRATFKYAYSDIDADAAAGAQRFNCRVTTGASFSAEEPLDDCRPNDKFVSGSHVASAFAGIDPSFRDGSPYFEHRITLATLNIEYDFSDSWSLTSLTGRYKSEQKYFQEFSRTAGPHVPTNSVTASNTPKYEATSQEFRLVSSLDGRLNFVLGAYVDDTYNTDRPCPVFFGLFICGDYEVDGKAYSAFAQVIAELADTVEITAGARYTDEEKSISADSLGPFVGPLPFTPDELDFDNVSPEVTIAWRPNSDLTVFAAYKEGFKSGGFNTAVGSFGAQNFEEELVDGVEIGIKSFWQDRTLRLNATAYRYDYDGLQVSSFNEVLNSISTSNAGEAKVQGIELEMLWVPGQVEGFSFSAALNRNEAEYTKFRQAPCYLGQTPATGCIGGAFQDLTGKEIIQAPDLTANVGIQLERGLGIGGLMFRATLDAVYSSDYFTQLSAGPPNHWDDGYHLWNASLAVFDDERGWEVALIGRNLSNEIYPVISNNSTFGQEITGSTNQPRSVMLRFTVKPGEFLN